MQHGSLTTKSRLKGPDVWQFDWSEKGPNGKRIYRKRGIGTIEEYPNQDAARTAVASLITEVNLANLRSTSLTMTVAQLCSHRTTRISPKQHVAQLFHETLLCRLLAPMDLAELGKAGTSRHKDYRIRILATAVALGEG
jgi:hypothetical protein